MSTCYKIVCGCDCCIFDKIMHSYLLARCYYYLEKLNTRVIMGTTEGLVKLQVVFLKPIIILRCIMVLISINCNIHVPGYNVFFSILWTCTDTLVMFDTLLWKMSKYFNTRSGIKQIGHKYVSNNKSLCLQSIIMLYW